MKKISLFILLLTVSLLYVGCKKCRNEDPRARIVNNGTDKVSVHIQTSGGNSVNINNILSGSASDFAYYEAGAVSFTIAFQNNTDTTLSVIMDDCWEYDILIDPNDNVSSLPTDRNE